ARYEDLVGGFVLEHPFVRGNSFANLVFSDYLRGWALSSPLSGAMASNRARFLATLPPVGPFFAEFLAALTAAGEVPTVPEDLVDDVVRSHGASSKSAHALYRHIGNGRVKLLLVDEGEGLASPHMDYTVGEVSGALVLRSPVS